MRSAEIAANLSGVSPRYIYETKRLKRDRPDLFDEMRDGRKTLQQAKREAYGSSRTKAPKLKRWNATIDPSTIPDDVLHAEVARRDSARAV